MKKYTRSFLIAICTIGLLAVCGCSRALGPVASTTPLTSSSNYIVQGNVSGTSTTFSILFMPFGTNTPLRNALVSAMQQRSADALIEVQADYYVFNFLYLFGVYTTEVRGKAIKLTQFESDLK